MIFTETKDYEEIDVDSFRDKNDILVDELKNFRYSWKRGKFVE